MNNLDEKSFSFFTYTYRHRYLIAIVVAGFLYATNPKPLQVYELLAEETRATLRDEIGKSALMSFLGVGVVEKITPDMMRSLMQVSWVNFYVGSVFVATPTELGKLGYKFRGENPEPFIICGIARKLFKCPDWVQNNLKGALSSELSPNTSGAANSNQDGKAQENKSFQLHNKSTLAKANKCIHGSDGDCDRFSKSLTSLKEMHPGVPFCDVEITRYVRYMVPCGYEDQYYHALTIHLDD